MAYWNEIGTKKIQFSMAFGKGINAYNDPLDIANDELLDSLNMCSDDYPMIRTRNDRVNTSLPQSTLSLWGIGNRANTYVHVLEANTWKYGLVSSTAWTEISTAIASPARASFIEFNTQTQKFTILAYSTGAVYNSYWDGTSYSTFADTNCPRSNLYTVHRYRLYGVDNDGRTLKYSAQGTITNWTLSNDAGYIDITEARGPIKAITTYADHPILWTDNSMHEVYGSAPDNFELVNVSNKIGCASRFAYAESDGKLFWLDYTGIYMYTGGLPRQIAYKAQGIIDRINWDYANLITAGAKGTKIYFSVPLDGSTSNNKIIVIDLINEKRGSNYTVNIEDGGFLGYTNIGEEIYSLSNSGFVVNMYSTAKTGLDNSTAIVWSMETRPITDELYLESAVRDMWLQHSGTTNATMAFSYTTNTDSTTFTQMAASSDFWHSTYVSRKRILPTSTQLQGMPFMKFQISGTGHKKISGLQINLITWGNIQ